MITIFYKLRTYETLPEDRLDRKSKFALYLGETLIGLVASPIHDGARLLLKMGYDPETLMTTQAKDSQCSSWKPQPLWKWAKWTTEEADDRSVRAKPFREWERVGVLEGLSHFYDPTYQNETKSLSAAPVPAVSVFQ